MPGVRPERPLKVGREDKRVYCAGDSRVHPQPDWSLFNHANLRPHIKGSRQLAKLSVSRVPFPKIHFAKIH